MKCRSTGNGSVCTFLYIYDTCGRKSGPSWHLNVNMLKWNWSTTAQICALSRRLINWQNSQSTQHIKSATNVYGLCKRINIVRMRSVLRDLSVTEECNKLQNICEGVRLTALKRVPNTSVPNTSWTSWISFQRAFLVAQWDRDSLDNSPIKMEMIFHTWILMHQY